MKVQVHEIGRYVGLGLVHLNTHLHRECREKWEGDNMKHAARRTPIGKSTKFSPANGNRFEFQR